MRVPFNVMRGPFRRARAVCPVRAGACLYVERVPVCHAEPVEAWAALVLLCHPPAVVIWWRGTMLPEIVLPETEPETEWILGEPLQKVSPKRDHARLQAAFGSALGTWAEGRGE